MVVNNSSKTPLPGPFSEDPEAQEPPHVPWTAQQAQAWRQTQRPISVWRLVMGQFLVGAVVALVAYLLAGSQAGLSAGYGALCAALPSALLAHGMRSALSKANPAAGFMVWELVKMALGAAMLVAAPKLVAPVSWLWLILGLILTLKVVFLAALWPRVVSAKS